MENLKLRDWIVEPLGGEIKIGDGTLLTRLRRIFAQYKSGWAGAEGGPPKAETREAKKSLLKSCLIIWPHAIRARLPHPSHPTDWLFWSLDILTLVRGESRHALHARLREMVVFQFGLLYWLHRDCGYSVADTKTAVGTLVAKSDFALEVSYEGAMQDLREMIPNVFQSDYELFRARKKMEVAAAKESGKLFDRLVTERAQVISVLCKGLRQVRVFECIVNSLSTKNIQTGKLPSPKALLNRLTDFISMPMEPAELVLLAVLGRINPTQLWPSYMHAKDIFDVLVFVGDHMMSIDTLATPELVATYRREILLEGTRKWCKPDARPSRDNFARSVSFWLSRPAAAKAVRVLQAA